MKINEVVIDGQETTRELAFSYVSEGRKPKHKDALKGKKSKSKDKDEDFDDDDMELDDLEDIENDEDDTEDDVPNILMQLRKAIDVDGKYPITFKDGDKVELSMDQISEFVQKYMHAKPATKEKMQEKAIKSLVDFLDSLKMDSDKPDKLERFKR